MPPLTYDLPISDGSTATEEPKIITALSQIKSLLDAGLDGDNISPSAGILLSQLEGGAAGQIPIVNTGGSLQYRDVTGDIHISQGGATNIQPGVVTNQDLAGSIGGDKFAAGAALANLTDGSVPEDKLESPSASTAYRLLLTGFGSLGFQATAATFGFTNQGVFDSNPVNIDTSVGGFSGRTVTTTRLTDTDFDVGGRSTMLLLRSQVLCNATAPNIDFLVSLHPISVAGPADELRVTLGTAISGSTVTHSTPSASAVATSNSTDFALPANGQYALGLITGGTMPAGASVQVSAQLYVHNV